MPESVINSLDIMWKGMLGLFAVSALVALLTGVMSKFTKPKKDAPQ